VPLVDVRRVPKPWGYELIWAHTEAYVGKLLHINAGHALSVQYHERKDETVFLLRGRMVYRVRGTGDRVHGDRVHGDRVHGDRVHGDRVHGDELDEFEMVEGQSFRNTPGTVHQMIAITDCDVLEASTPHLDDVVRLVDRYGREGTSAP
jgi:quercetin dioxygenase-like cupin family protein